MNIIYILTFLGVLLAGFLYFWHEVRHSSPASPPSHPRPRRHKGFFRTWRAAQPPASPLVRYLTECRTAAAVISAFCFPLCLPAAEYGIGKTFLNMTVGTNTSAVDTTGTNGNAIAMILSAGTNLSANVLDCTKITEFVLDVQIGLTNASAGNCNLQWDTSADGTHWGYETNAPWVSGNIAIPLTNAPGAIVYWRTNITVGSIGYWRPLWFTNLSSSAITNIVIRAWVKPTRVNTF